MENLRAEKLFIGNDGRNEIGRLKFDQIEGIRVISIERAFYDATRSVLGDVEGYASRIRLPELQESSVEKPKGINDPELDSRPRLEEQEERDLRREGESLRGGEERMNG